MSERTVSRTTFGPVVSALDAAIGFADRCGLGLGDLDADRLIGAAVARTGSADLGDPRYREGLDRVLTDVEARGLSNLGRVAQRNAFIKALSNRALLARYQRENDVAAVPIRRPIFVLGFPRTGTTLLQNLLARAPGRRGLPFWEAITPLPVHPDPVVDERRRKRVAAATLAVAYRVAPEMRTVHYIAPDTLEECWPLFVNSFQVRNWDLQGYRGYGEWLDTEADTFLAYREYRELLRAMLHRRPADQLVLKCPEHLWSLDALLAAFPDACVVWTHRDPYTTIASYCSLISLQWRTMRGSFDPVELGAYITDRFHEGVARAASVRARSNPKRFFDVRMEDLVRDPVATVRAIERHFELDHPVPDATIRGYVDTERDDARGRHKYDPAFYALDREAIDARYRSYIDGFGVGSRAA
jgi:hypothetical protein